MFNQYNISEDYDEDWNNQVNRWLKTRFPFLEIGDQVSFSEDDFIWDGTNLVYPELFQPTNLHPWFYYKSVWEHGRFFLTQKDRLKLASQVQEKMVQFLDYYTKSFRLKIGKVKYDLFSHFEGENEPTIIRKRIQENKCDVIPNFYLSENDFSFHFKKALALFL